MKKIKNILSNNFKYEIVDFKSVYIDSNKFIEIGPHNNFKTSWCSNVLNIFKRCNLDYIEQIEYSTLYLKDDFNRNYDKMLYKIYNNKLESKDYEIVESYYIDKDQVQEFSDKNGLGFTEDDINLLYSIKEKLTNVELFDLSQCNSEHARHHFFNGIIDGEGLSLLKKLKIPIKRINIIM